MFATLTLTIMTTNTLNFAEELKALGFSNLLPMRDRVVFLPTAKWMNSFLAKVNSEIQRLRQLYPLASKEQFDCDDCVEVGLNHALRARLASTEFSGAGHAIGRAGIIISNFGGSGYLGIKQGGSHGTGIAKVRDLGWCFWEPQTKRWEKCETVIAGGGITPLWASV